jgi:hypothetical protein
MNYTNKYMPSKFSEQGIRKKIRPDLIKGNSRGATVVANPGGFLSNE